MGLEILANTEIQCSACQDTGWVMKGSLAVQCECVRERAKKTRMQDLVARSGLKGSLLEKSFDNYVAKTKQQKDASEYVRHGGSFFLIGDFGVGKTHLLAASVNDALGKGVAAVFFSVPWLLQMIREDLLSNRPIGILEKVCEVEYLALDDLGKEKPSETVQEKLFMIIDRREVDGLRTSVTSNLDPETLGREKIDGAIVSRLMGMCKLLVLEGEDHRRIERKR